jgi:hypothetical protein
MVRGPRVRKGRTENPAGRKIGRFSFARECDKPAGMKTALSGPLAFALATLAELPFPALSGPLAFALTTLAELPFPALSGPLWGCMVPLPWLP